MDELTALVEKYPGIVNTPVIIGILGFAMFIFFFGARGTRSFRPKRFSRILTICLRTGCYLMLFCCLWGCLLLGGQTSLAKQNHQAINLPLAATVGLSWLLIIVPCLLAENPKKRVTITPLN